jgi:hypothetical protein
MEELGPGADARAAYSEIVEQFKYDTPLLTRLIVKGRAGPSIRSVKTAVKSSISAAGRWRRAD